MFGLDIDCTPHLKIYIYKKLLDINFKVCFHYLTRKSQTRREAGTESHGSKLTEIAGLPGKADPVFLFFKNC
jgi:hypothetical protein